MKHVVDKNFYPGYVRKAITFSIDDGNIPMDKKFVAITKPHGILGTFNLNSNNLGQMSREEYLEFYRDYGIANHCKYHPVPMRDGVKYEFSDEPFDPETSDPTLVYKHPTVEGLYKYHITLHHPRDERRPPEGWSTVTDVENFKRFAEEGLAELSEFFGRDNIKSFIWPGGYQSNAEAHAYLREKYRDVRKTGCTLDTTGFALPEDKGHWTYNANHRNLVEVMEKYRDYPDDGELKFFCLGVHSKDFETDDKWEDLKRFSELCGDRPDLYYYASVEDIFDYEEAIDALVVTDEYVENTSDISVFVKVDGASVEIAPKSKMLF